MRLFDDEKVGCYLDDIGHRIEKTKTGDEVKMIDLTLRVQPFTPALAVALDPDVRAMIFNLTDGTPKPKLKAVEFKLAVEHQTIEVYLLPEGDVRPRLAVIDAEISGFRARTEKGVDGYAFVFYASFGPVGAEELEFICEWHTQQRFLSFYPAHPSLLDDEPAGATARA